MLTPLDFYYLTKELKKIERSRIKRIYKSTNLVFEFKMKKDRFYLVVGKNFCYLDCEKPKETETRGFVNFLLSKLKNKRLLKIEQNDFNKILILLFLDFDLILDFIGRGNIILRDKENKIVSCLFQREFRDRKIIVGEKYNLPPKSDKLHLGEIYEIEKRNLGDLLNQKINPRVYFKNGDKFFVSPFEIETLKNLKFKRKESFSEAIKEFFCEEKKTKEEIIREKQKENLEKYKLEEEKFRRQADLILKNKTEIERIIEKFKKEKKIIKPVKEVLEKKGIIILEFNREQINLKINRDLKEEIDLLYKKSKKAKEKMGRIEKLLLREINIKTGKKEEGKKRKEWYEQFRHFHTSDNFLVVAGKDADTNEKLIKKYCKKNDIVLHAYIPGSPFGVIRSEGREITKQAIKESAQFVGCYSKFWISKLGIAEVYRVKPEQVSKSAKGYLKKGSFMIYGKRNFLKVELKLMVGVNKKLGVTIYPANSPKKPGNFITIIPGEKEGKGLVEKIKSKLIEKAKKEDKEKIQRINPDKFLKIVPFGKGETI